MKKGFTLVELLAVISILAVIILIVAPIVISSIDDARSSSKENSLELYGRAVEQAVSLYRTNNSKKITGAFEVSNDGKVLTSKTDPTIELTINYSGNSVVCEDIMIRENGTAAIKDCTVDGVVVKRDYGFDNPIGVLVEGEEYDDLPKYKVKVNSSEEYYFYLLSENDDGTVNLIMDRNICGDGTTNYSSSDYYCRYNWGYQSETNNCGPEIAMHELYEATKNWTNIPDMIINYTDENNVNSDSMGYIGIKTNLDTMITTIISKDSIYDPTIGDETYPLKARLPNQREIEDAGCNIGQTTADYGSCPVSLMVNLKYADVPDDKYSANSSNTSGTILGNLEGYWLLASSPGTYDSARRIDYFGIIVNNPTYDVDAIHGIRPVITIPKYDLKD